jgi:small subunit ribosomal protein S18
MSMYGGGGERGAAGGRFGGPSGKGNVRKQKRPKTRVKIKKKDPIWVDGVRPRPMFVDYKDIELLKKMINRHGKIVSRRKTGCTALSQHAVATAIKRARFMALLPYVGE